MTPKILILEEDGWDRDTADVLYKITDRPTKELRAEYMKQTKFDHCFVAWLVEKGYCLNIPDEQIEYFYY